MYLTFRKARVFVWIPSLLGSCLQCSGLQHQGPESCYSELRCVSAWWWLWFLLLVWSGCSSLWQFPPHLWTQGFPACRFSMLGPPRCHYGNQTWRTYEKRHSGDFAIDIAKCYCYFFCFAIIVCPCVFGYVMYNPRHNNGLKILNTWQGGQEPSDALFWYLRYQHHCAQLMQLVGTLVYTLKTILKQAFVQTHAKCNMCKCACGHHQCVHLPDSVGWVISFLLSELVECVIDGAAYLVTDLSELFTKGESSSALIPVLIPLTPIQLISWKEEHIKGQREKEQDFVNVCSFTGIPQRTTLIYSLSY